MTDLSRSGALEALVERLDISPSDFKRARDRYLAVSNWLAGGEYQAGDAVDVYLQGSFKLGTVVRPYLNGQDVDYDIDQVCDISGRPTEARALKHEVGERLKANADYGRMLDAEGRRCWTLKYAASDGSPGFHLDVLPSRQSASPNTQIEITHKDGGTYHWHTSNPKGYYEWFAERNALSPEALQEQMRSLYEANRTVYASVDDVPKQLARTSLRRAIQVMKRHRDVCFSGREGAPISIILTTICAYQYDGTDVLSTLRGFVGYVGSRLAAVVRGESLPVDGVLDYMDGKWLVTNPADRNENFSDRWADDPELADNFFAWVYQLRRDLDAFERSDYPPDMRLAAGGVQTEAPSYGTTLLSRLRTIRVKSSQEFLDLIHQGIEGRVPWNDIKPIAERNVREETEEESKDVAWVNYYQVKVHSGERLSDENKAAIRAILSRHPDSLAFVYCCNVLLGTVTERMLRAAVAERREDEEDVLRWPITRLAASQITGVTSAIVPAPKTAYFAG